MLSTALQKGRRRFVAAGAVVSVLALTATGCGEDGSSSKAGSSAKPASQSVATEAVSGVPSLAELYKGTGGEPPASSPPPAKGKSVWWISCGQVVPSCAAVAQGGADASKALGFDYHIADGNLNQAGGFVSAMNTAIAAKPDAIVVFGIDCPNIKQPLETAKQQGIKVMGVQNLDCSATGGPALFDVPMVYTPEVKDNVQFWRAFGKHAADTIIAMTGGKAKIINTPGDLTLNHLLDESFKAELKKCANCEIVDDVPFTQSGLVPNGASIQAFRSSLVKHPEATAVFMPWDFMMSSLGGAKAIKESGIKAKLFGGEASADSAAIIRQGQAEAAPNAFSHLWVGWAVMDNLNRNFNGKPAVPQAQGFTVVDREHGLPAPNKDFEGDFDYVAHYSTLWTAAGK